MKTVPHEQYKESTMREPERSGNRQSRSPWFECKIGLSKYAIIFFCFCFWNEIYFGDPIYVRRIGAIAISLVDLEFVPRLIPLASEHTHSTALHSLSLSLSFSIFFFISPGCFISTTLPQIFLWFPFLHTHTHVVRSYALVCGQACTK